MAFNIKSIMSRNGGQQGQQAPRPSVQRPTAAPSTSGAQEQQAGPKPFSTHAYDFSLHDENSPGQSRGSLSFRKSENEDGMYDVHHTSERRTVSPEEKRAHGPNGTVTQTTKWGQVHSSEIEHDAETGALKFNVQNKEQPNLAGPRSLYTLRAGASSHTEGKPAEMPGDVPRGLAHIPQTGMFTTPPKNSRYPK